MELKHVVTFSCSVCVCQPANGCFTCHSLVEIIFFSNLTSFTVPIRKKEQKAQKIKKKFTKTEKNYHKVTTLKCWSTLKHW